MGIGAITPELAGSVTAPSVFPLVLPAVETLKAFPHGLHSWMKPGGEIRMLMWADGEGPRRHVLTDTPFRTGLLAPFAALTAIPTGVRATALFDIDVDGNGASIYTMLDGDRIWLVDLVTFVDVFSVTPTSTEVLVESTGDLTLDNVKGMVDNSQTEGVKYQFHKEASKTLIRGTIEVIDHPTSYQVNFRVKDYGTSGNSVFASLQSGLWDADSVLEASGDGGTAIGIQNYFQNGTDGSGIEPGAATYGYVYKYGRKADGALSGVSPIIEASQTNPQNINLTVIANPDVADGIDFKTWLRTPANAGRFFNGYDIVSSATIDTDDLSNTLLEKRKQHDSRTSRGYAGGMIERSRYLCPYKGAWLAAGFKNRATYSAGTADLTNGSRVVTFTGGYPTTVMEHWTFQTNASIADDSIQYTIIWVDEANKKAYLDRTWEGVTNSSRVYKSTDTRDPFRIFRSEPTLPNQSDELFFTDGMTSQDPEGCTGLVPFGRSVIALTRTGIWELSGPLSALSLDHVWEGIGCVGGHTIVDPGDGFLYWLAQDGVKRWSGRGEPQDLSNPGFLGREAKGIARTVARINQSAVHNAFGHYDPVRRLIRWFVPLDNNITNEHALVFHFDTAAWSLDSGLPSITYVKTVSDPSGNLRNLAGTVGGELLELDVSNSDGAYGFEPHAEITASTTNTITCAAASFPTSGDGLDGIPVVVTSSDGEFTSTYISSNTGTVLTLAHYLTAVPTGSVKVGGIHMRIESGRWDDGDPGNKTILESVRVFFTPQTDGQFWMSAASDQGSPQIRDGASGDLTLTDGEQHFWFRIWGRQNKFQFDCVEPGCDPSIRMFQIWARIREKAFS